MPEFVSHPEDSAPEQANPLDGVDFTLDGVKFTCEGYIDFLDRGELALLAFRHVDVMSTAGVAGAAQFLQMALGEAQYQRFRAHTHHERTHEDVTLTIINYLQTTARKKLEASSGRPTMPPLVSSPGQQEKAGSISSPPPAGRDAVIRHIKLGALDGEVIEQAAPSPLAPGEAPADMPPADAPVAPEFREESTTG